MLNNSDVSTEIGGHPHRLGTWTSVFALVSSRISRPCVTAISFDDPALELWIDAIRTQVVLSASKLLAIYMHLSSILNSDYA